MLARLNVSDAAAKTATYDRTIFTVSQYSIVVLIGVTAERSVGEMFDVAWVVGKAFRLALA